MNRKTRMTVAAAFAAAATFAFGQHQPIQVTVNGSPVNFEGQGPRMRGDRVMVPLRGVLEQEGAHVDWNPANQTVIAHRGGTTVRLTIGETTASVNGSPVTLDVPALIIHGSTMVPLRFVGESLGDNVHWDPADYLVQITTQGEDYNIPRTRQTVVHTRPMMIAHAPFVLPAGTVVAVTLDDQLSSDQNRRGDGFTTTVDNHSDGLPSGTQIHGYIAGLRPANGERPGMLELRFDNIMMPDGTRYGISGTLIGLDDRYITHHGDRIMARDTAPNRAAFTGYGAGAGLVIGIAGHRPIEDTAIGALLGNAIGAMQQRQAHNVHLAPGMTFGVRLQSEVRIRGRDAG